MNTLLFRLIGPMQSWGSRSRFEDRDTHLEPTKSGVVGLLCAALGRDRAEPVDDLAALRMGVRVDRPGRVETDYHTARNVAIASGGTARDTVISRRHYLADARFLVGLESPDVAILQTVADALSNPRWLLSLGRKSFPLSLPPCPRIVNDQSLEEALQHESWLKLYKGEIRREDTLRLVVETQEGIAMLSDQPISFDQRRFGLRRFKVWDIPSNVIAYKELEDIAL